VGGTENSDLRVDDCHAPLLALTSWKVDETARTLAAQVTVTDGAAGNGIDTNSLAVQLDGQPLKADFSNNVVAIHADKLTGGKHTVRIHVKEKGGLAARELYLPLWIEKEPFTWSDAVIYFAMVDRFVDGNPANDKPLGGGVPPQADFKGGDWVGLKSKIDAGYFDQLGVRAIWISGPNLQPDISGKGTDGRDYSGYHGYWPASPTEVDPRFGTWADLKAAVDSAHQHGIRVLIDFVANHVHLEHPWWTQKMGTNFFNPLDKNDGTQCVCGAGSSWDPPEGIVCWFTTYLPDINYTDQDAVDAIGDAAIYWLKESGADALRVDALKQMPHIVGATLRGRLHDELEVSGVPTYLVGETYVGPWSTDPNQGQNLIAEYVSPMEMNGQFDFPLKWEIDSAIAHDGSMRPLDNVLSKTFTFYGPTAIMSPFLGNHDVPRFISVANGNDTSQDAGYNNPPQAPQSVVPYQKLKLAFTILLGVPGAPLLYYGDEIGMPGAADPDNRRMMRFDNLAPSEADVLSHVQKLGQARQADPALRRGDYKTIWVDDDVLVFTRHIQGEPARIIAINHRGTEQKRMVPLPPELEIKDGTIYLDALSGAMLMAAGGFVSIDLAPMTSAVYRWQGPPGG
jgi:glycosidase